MAVEIGVFRLIREALYFFSLILSSHRTRELYELLWELQIDVSIIYSFSYEKMYYKMKMLLSNIISIHLSWKMSALPLEGECGTLVFHVLLLKIFAHAKKVCNDSDF